MTAPELRLQHRYTKGDPAAPVLLLLHGTGGTPEDLVPLAEAFDPKAAVLAPAATESEYGASRWFRRLAEGVFDTDDVVERTHELADFVTAARKRYGIEDRPLIAIGFSNGANIAAAGLLLRPEVFNNAILFSAMMPVPDPPGLDLSGTRVFLSNGDRDPMAPAASTASLVQALRDRSADVTTFRFPGGHEITRGGFAAAAAWLKRTPATTE
jgi:phospholipase/carboxylesterase